MLRGDKEKCIVLGSNTKSQTKKGKGVERMRGDIMQQNQDREREKTVISEKNNI